MDYRDDEIQNKVHEIKNFGIKIQIENEEEIWWRIIDIMDLITCWTSPEKKLAKTQKELLVTYAVHGYNVESKRLFAEKTGKNVKNIRVLDSNLKTHGYLVDYRRNDMTTRDLNSDIKNFRLFLALNTANESKTVVVKFEDQSIVGLIQ